MAVADPLDLALDTLGYRSGDGLVERGVNHLGPAREFVWRDLLRKTEVTATYFRGSVPLVAFARADDERVHLVQRQLWNFSRVPLLIAGTSSGIGVYSCYAAPSRPDDAISTALRLVSPHEDLSAVLAPFSRSEVETGALAAKRPDFFKRDDRVDRKLLRNLRQLRARLSASPVKSRAVDALIGRSIFVRYLEDRRILTAEHFQELLSPYSTYTDVLRSGVEATYELFDVLSGRFNGDVFSSASGEEAQVEAHDLQVLAGFLEGEDVASGQASFWPYDFSVIPPELISSIYEQLLEETQDADAAYYTPRTIVDLILDEVLPWERGGTPRILDPACGSGIFLTEAYRRLVFRASRDRPLSFSDLSALLTTSVHGIDQSAAAVSVAAFGLYLALLEELDPPSAWADAKLPQLIGENLLIQDFFDDTAFPESAFDVIVANPPWKKELPPAAARFVAQRGYPVAAKQVAHAFLWRALDRLRPGGMLGFLMPAKVLHNKSDRAAEVRKHLFKTAEVETIVDLSILRRGLFEAAVAPAAVIIARAKTHEECDAEPTVLHAVPRSSPLQAAVDGFVVSPLDIHLVSQQLVASHDDVWKVLLWGSERDLDVINRVRSRHRLLREVADDRGWIHGRGFERTGPDRNSAHALLGLPFVRTDSITPFAAEFDSEPLGTRIMHRPRDPRLYQGPHVLIRRGSWKGRLAAALVEETSAFNNAVFGVAAPAADAEHLRLLTAYVNSSFGNYYHFLTSSSWGVERNALEANEYLSLPFAEPSAASYDILRILKEGDAAGARDPKWWRRLDDAVFRAYDVDEAADQIRDTLRTALDQFMKGPQSISFRAPLSHDRTAYRRTLLSVLRASLANTRVDVELGTADSPYMLATVSFESQSSTPQRASGDVAELIDDARQEVENWSSPVIILQPSALLLRGTQAHVLRPAEAQYWTIARAQADASEIIGEIARLSPSKQMPVAPVYESPS